jgi:cell division protein FtsL
MSIVRAIEINAYSKRRIIVLLALVLFPLVIMVIWSLNRLSTFGDQISSLQQTKESLLLENQVLENKISELSSIKKIEEVAKSYGFEKISKIEYLEINDLALNQ